jgi:multidrug efflux system membrane fusion protein
MPPAPDDLTPGQPGEGPVGGDDARRSHTRGNGAENGDGRAQWADSRSPDRDEHATQPLDHPGQTLFGRPPPARRRSLPSTLAWIAAAVVAAILIGWGVSKLIPAKGGPGGPGGFGGGRGQVTVSTAKATLGTMPIQFQALGTVTPLATVTVHTRIAGVLDKVDFHEGQMVRVNQRLALVDPRPYAIAVKQAQGQLLKDQAALDNAKLDLQRFTTLVAEDSISKQTRDTQAALVKQLEGTVLSDQANLDNAKLNLAYCTVVSPVAGRVGLRHVDPGNFVQTGDANGIVAVTQISPIDVQFTLPEDDVPTVTRRLGQGAVLPVTVLDRASVNTLGQGALTALDNEVDPTTGTVKVKARFANVDGALFPAQFVNVNVLVDNLQNVVLAPTAAIRHGAPGDFVFVLSVADRTAHMRPVKLGPTTGETTAILSGLNAGETVITAGGDRLKDGAHVMLPGDRPQFGGAGGGRGGGRGGRGHWRGGQGGQGQGGQGGGYGGYGGQGQSDQAGGAPSSEAAPSAPQGGAPQSGPHAGWGGHGGKWQGRHRNDQSGGQNGGGQGAGSQGGGSGGL